MELKFIPFTDPQHLVTLVYTMVYFYPSSKNHDFFGFFEVVETTNKLDEFDQKACAIIVINTSDLEFISQASIS